MMSKSESSQVPLEFIRLSEGEMLERANSALERMQTRRSVRHFDPAPVPLEVLRRCIAAAGTAPSGAHKQPWTFCLVTNPEVKRSIRVAAEKEEYENYHGRMSERWLEDLKAFDTNHLKPHLEDAPALIGRGSGGEASKLLCARVRGDRLWHVHQCFARIWTGLIDAHPVTDGFFVGNFAPSPQ